MARICVYLNVEVALPTKITIRVGANTWEQPLDYEYISFRCLFCHKYGHLLHQCPHSILKDNQTSPPLYLDTTLAPPKQSITPIPATLVTPKLVIDSLIPLKASSMKQKARYALKSIPFNMSNAFARRYYS